MFVIIDKVVYDSNVTPMVIAVTNEEKKLLRTVSIGDIENNPTIIVVNEEEARVIEDMPKEKHWFYSFSTEMPFEKAKELIGVERFREEIKKELV